jgi:hypothetical protein
MVESKPNMGTTFKIYSMIKKENMGDRRWWGAYQIIVAKIIQKQICSRLFLPSAKDGLEVLINTLKQGSTRISSY